MSRLKGVVVWMTSVPSRRSMGAQSANQVLMEVVVSLPERIAMIPFQMSCMEFIIFTPC